LPFLNNEVNHKDSEMYKARIMGLNSFTVVEWDSDGVVFPRQSELFDQISGRWGKVVELDPIDREQE
jgi:hypothetical protein